MITKQRK